MKKTAHWICHTHVFRSDEYECSNCGETVAKPKKTCPNCGCTMRGSKGDLGWVDEMEVIDAFFED